MKPKRIRKCIECGKIHTSSIISTTTGEEIPLQMCRSCLFGNVDFKFNVDLNLKEMEDELLKDKNNE